MKALVIYLRIYGACLQGAMQGALKNGWTLLLPLVLVVVSDVGAGIAVRMGLIGGIFYGLLRAALFSAYLYFVREVVSGSKVTLGELKASVGAYFWSLINLFFIYWIVRLVVGMSLGGQVLMALTVVALIALNAAPEVIAFRGTYGGLDTIRSSFSFLQSNVFEWLVPNLLVGAALYFGWTQLAWRVPVWVADPVAAALFHLFFLFRGHLFIALDGSSHRQRMFKYRYGG